MRLSLGFQTGFPQHVSLIHLTVCPYRSIAEDLWLTSESGVFHLWQSCLSLKVLPTHTHTQYTHLELSSPKCGAQDSAQCPKGSMLPRQTYSRLHPPPQLKHYTPYGVAQTQRQCVCSRRSLAVFSVMTRLQNGATVQLAVAALYLEASLWNKD